MNYITWSISQVSREICKENIRPCMSSPWILAPYEISFEMVQGELAMKFRDNIYIYNEICLQVFDKRMCFKVIADCRKTSRLLSYVILGYEERSHVKEKRRRKDHFLRMTRKKWRRRVLGSGNRKMWRRRVLGSGNRKKWRRRVPGSGSSVTSETMLHCNIFSQNLFDDSVVDACSFRTYAVK